ncbi:MAG TPA: FGLLP motif-containing membrane protein [Acidimicrobiales bacterium]|nr:FGLLP motif-containing membrane protein [Acidimicrobiales bacterium]
MGLEIAGAGYRDCRFVYLFLDGQRIGTVRPGAGGTIDGDGFSVPGDTSPGSHQVTTSCQSSGRSVRATTTFMVTASSMHRSGFVTAIPQPHQISLALGDLATSAIAALLILLLFAFPYELFNSTVEENYDEIRRWFRLPARAAAVARSKARTAAFFVLNLAAAAVYGFLSPDFGLNVNSLVLLLGMFVALVVMSAVFSLPAAVVIHRRFGEWGRLNFLPGSLGISVVMVVMSRLLHFQPGYVYGAMAGLAFRSALNESTQGRLTAANWFFSLLLAIGAWFARVPVSEAAAQPDASVWWMGVEVCLALIFLWGIESLAVAMLPMRFLDGRKVIDWNRTMWAVLMFLGAFVTVHILLSAGSGYVGQTGEQVRFAVLLLFLGFGAFSVSVWAYFRYRPQRREPAPT